MIPIWLLRETSRFLTQQCDSPDGSEPFMCQKGCHHVRLIELAQVQTGEKTEPRVHLTLRPGSLSERQQLAVKPNSPHSFYFQTRKWGVKGSVSVQHERLEANRAAASKTSHLNDPAGLQGSKIHLLLCRKKESMRRQAVVVCVCVSFF